MSPRPAPDGVDPGGMPDGGGPGRDDPLLRFRPRFPILERTNYLISNSLGAVPATVSASLQQYYETWATRGVRAWEESWWTLASDLGDLVAPLLGADPGDVVFQPNVTTAHAVALGGFEFAPPRRRIVTDAMHFPSILYLLDQQRRDGAEVVVVPSEDGIAVETDRIIEAIDEHTAVVCLSHVLFKSAYVHDVAAIARRCRRVGAVSIIDGYQAVGTIPVDVKALGIDVYIGGCLKWLCGGPGCGVPLGRSGDPTTDEAQAHWLDVAPTAVRLRAGTRPSRRCLAVPGRDAEHPGAYAARPGLEIVLEAGIDAIREKSLRQTGRLLERAERAGYQCTTPRDPDRRGGTVAIDVENGYEISRGLKSLDILCDYRPGAGIRLSPHFYTLDVELDRAIEAIGEVMSTGAWRAFTTGRSTVT